MPINGLLTTEIVEAQAFIALKDKITAELTRRSHDITTTEGTGGSLEAYTKAPWLYTSDIPTKGSLATSNQANKIVEPANAVAVRWNVLSANDIIASLQSIDAAFDQYSTTDLYSEHNDCDGFCSGLCSVTCVGGCREGCSGTCIGGCSDTCKGSCTGGCSGGCQSTCTGGCSGGCSNTCYTSCSDGCQNGCYTTCTGTCKGGCYTTCSGGCKGSCSQQCADTCSVSCKDACTSTCKSSCSGTCKGTCTGGCSSTCTKTCANDACRAVCAASSRWSM